MRCSPPRAAKTCPERRCVPASVRFPFLSATMPSRPRPRSSRFKLPPLPPACSNPWLRYSVMTLLFVVLTLTVPRWWAGRDGHRWYDGDAGLVLAHARSVAATVEAGVSVADFTTESDLFKNEWQFGAYQMAALGLLQVCLDQPETRAELLPAAERAIDELLGERIREFDTKKWGEDPLATLATSDKGHAAYLGYLNLVLGLHRRVAPDSRFAAQNDAVSAALARRLVATRHGILETYPGEAYPVDNAAVLGSLLLHARVAGVSHAIATAPLLARFRLAWRDPRSGLLYQSIDPLTGGPIDAARASGTSLAAVLLSYGEREVAREFYKTTRDRCADSLLGFGYIDEYHIGSAGGPGDIDSGPLIFGISPSATGFTLAAARMFGERAQFVSLYRTAHLTGTPTSRGDARFFVTGGPLGNAILLAMFTARPDLP